VDLPEEQTTSSTAELERMGHEVTLVAADLEFSVLALWRLRRPVLSATRRVDAALAPRLTTGVVKSPPRSTIVQPSPVHTGLTDEPAAERARLLETMVLPAGPARW
jgi:hypothetical protein